MSIRRATRATVGILVIAAATAAFGGSARAATTTNPTPAQLQGECPTVIPLDELSTGMRGWALSVTAGRNAVTFNAEVLGVLENGVGPGRDIIIVNLSGDAVQAAGGLWYGASGSPVFFRDAVTGKYEVAGAIAYGLAGGGSTLAGLTPAQDMASVLGLGGGDELESDRVEVPLGLAARMADATGLSVAETGSLVRLLTPLSASGLTDRGLAHLRAAVAKEKLPFIPYMGSSASSNPPVPTGTVRAGESIAAALSLGDVTMGGVGTATWVCDGRVVAFGHPMNWSGETTMAARAADTITIVSDPIFGSYKLANIAESVGTITQDRLAAIAGALGAGPATSPVTSSVTDLDTGRSRTGESQAVLPEFLPYLAFAHLFSNTDATIDRIGPGSAAIAYTIRGTRSGGGEWALARSNRYASPWDISIDSAVELWGHAEILQGFEAEEIRITGVDVSDLDVEKAYKRYRITKVLFWNGERYASRRYVRVKPGKLVRLRVVLDPQHRAGTATRDVALRAPKGKRRSGVLEVLGGESASSEVCIFCEEAFFDEEAEGGDGGGAPSFDELLDQLGSQPRGDDLVVQMRFGSGKVLAKTTRRLDAVVGGGRAFGILIRK